MSKHKKHKSKHKTEKTIKKNQVLTLAEAIIEDETLALKKFDKVSTRKLVKLVIALGRTLGLRGCNTAMVLTYPIKKKKEVKPTWDTMLGFSVGAWTSAAARTFFVEGFKELAMTIKEQATDGLEQLSAVASAQELDDIVPKKGGKGGKKAQAEEERQEAVSG